MNFNYSYRSFLITSLLFGIMVLFLYSVKLSRYKVEKEESYAVEYSEEDLQILEEEEEIQIPIQSVIDPFETHRAFNEEDELFDGSSEEEFEPSEELAETLEKMNEAIGQGLTKKTTKVDPTANNKKKSSSKKSSESEAKGKSNRKSTNSYRLVDRTAMFFPNPVYTCDGYGKVVINIEVSETGRVVGAKYNARKSTTRNQCLIDNAINYANKSRFNSKAGKKSQLGSITYVFPGHQ